MGHQLPSRTRGRFRIACAALISAVTALSAWATPADAAPATRFAHLDPGGQPRLAERVPVNVVFLGYDKAQVARAPFLAALPKRYQPVVRDRLPYGVTDTLGITYTYDYQVRYTDQRYEDRFFGELTRLGKPAPLTQFQTAYNDQERNVLDVRDNVFIDAPSVERWLAANPPAGVDTRNDTMVFINWYGRSDFRFHVYTKTGEPDPDTGYDFGVQRESRKFIAWGGTTADDEETGLGATHRIWFHDLSAGPESWTENWNVDERDLDGNGVEDVRMPAVWEYTAGGYRAPGDLTGDLAKIARYVGINLIFTSSPLFPPELPTATPPTSIDVDVNVYQGMPGVDVAARYVKADLVRKELGKLRWRNTLSVDTQSLEYGGEAKRCYDALMADTPCYPDVSSNPWSNLFLQNQAILDQVLDDTGKVDYEDPVFAYALPAGTAVPALGMADDDWRTGNQSQIYAWISPEIIDSGYGLTTTLIHEVGHHLGLSHPHDGYDSERGIDYGGVDDYYFSWAGDEQNSIMSYIDLNWDFSQFDRDNSDRFLTAAYVKAANTLAAAVLADPDAARANALLAQADLLAGQAQRAFAAHTYRGGYALAQAAYQQVVAAAHLVGADTAAVTTRAAATGQRPKAEQPAGYVDTFTQGPRTQP